MTRIRLHEHPFEARPPRSFEAESIGQWLLQHYGQQPGVEVHVYAGEPSQETDVTGNVPALLRNDAPEYVVLEAPGLEPVSWTALLTNLAISTAISLAANFLFARDPKPLDNRSQESPNNALAQRENRLRLLQRVEDIFGTVRAIPSLLMEPYVKYIDHRQVEYMLLCIGRGYYEVSDMRDGDTLLSEIDGASARIYPPFASPNMPGSHQLPAIGDPIIDPVLSVARSISVEGIVLKPLNQIQLSPGLAYMFRGPGAVTFALPVASSADIIFQPGPEESGESRRPNFAAVAAAGQSVTVSMANKIIQRHHLGTLTAAAAGSTISSNVQGFFAGVVPGSTVDLSSAFTDPANQGVKTVLTATPQSITVSGALVDEAGGVVDTDYTLTVNYSGTRTIATVGNGYITLTGGPLFPGEASGHTANISIDNDLEDWTGWITLPNPSRTEVWTNVVARGGMFKDDGSQSSASVSYEVQIERLDGSLNPTGQVETITGSISGATSVERAETLEHVTGWVGPARVRARRTTPFDYDFNGFVQDEITWIDLYAVEPVTKPHFGNKTIIHTVTRATPGATGLRRRQLNCLASRLLPTYNGAAFSGAFNAAGALASGTIHPTSRIVDILAAVTVDAAIGARPISDLDVAQVWSVQQALNAWNPQCGQFNYTFDSDELSYEETVNAIADAAFCKAYRQNGQIRLALDRPQAASVALFTHRSKRPKSESITRRFVSESDYDGVELVYADPDSDTQETIRLPLDGSWTKLKRVEVTGIRSFEQAWLRANRELQRLRYERLTIETVVTTDARALLPNSRIDVVDNTRFKSFDGEVLAQSGLELTLSREVEFVPAAPHSIVLKKRDGGIQAIAVTAGPAANRVVLANPPAEAIVTEPTPEGGVRTEFSFAADSARGAQAWILREIEPPDGGYMRLRAANYAPEYYAADSLPIPPKASVIN
jgi:hypothetical protein